MRRIMTYGETGETMMVDGRLSLLFLCEEVKEKNIGIYMKGKFRKGVLCVVVADGFVRIDLPLTNVPPIL